ncbi:hypothetical protein [Cardinium endosymbiont of Sogatella furcifera]|uniref:hypothetical protein n=1 Tax=Cardinium endosymbiont of Sogatella furcifera TaxID=650378 RepID=UPI000E0CD87A|nr:hypothetical protein [Cardinium endosymbiont of Sogatella furcifera]
MSLLGASLYSLIHLCLYACSNSMPISRVQYNTNKAHTSQNKQSWPAAEKAYDMARAANHNITGIDTRFYSKIDKLSFYYDQYNPIQKKRASIYAHCHKSTAVGKVAVQGIMPKLREYAYKLCEYALVMKLALEHPSLVAKGNVVYIAQAIIHDATVILDRNDLAQHVHTRLQQVTPTISKNYSRHIASFVLNHEDDTPAYQMPSDHMMDTLQSILIYGHATIDTIDSQYHEINDVFFNADPFEQFRNNAYDAFNKANRIHHKFQNVWAPILTDGCFLPELQQAFNDTIEARDAAQTAEEAYRYFAEYFDQFIPAVQTMLNSCDAFLHTAQRIAGNHTTYLRPYINDIHLIKLDIEEALDKLSEMIWSAHQAANQYKNSYDQYSRFIHEIKYTTCMHLSRQWEKRTGNTIGRLKVSMQQSHK